MKNRNYWVVSPNVKNNDEEHKWKEFLSTNPYSFIGWDENNKFGNKFINEIKKDDVIINAQRKSWEAHVFGIGIASYDKCEWQEIENTPSGAYCRELNPYLTKERVSDLNLEFKGTAYYGNNKQIPALYQLHPQSNENDKRLVEIIEKELYMVKKEQYIQEFVGLLNTNKNIILTGAPGTGKTYLAKQIAKQMIGVKTDEELEKSEQFGFVQFHPSYDYTDFVEGLRPTPPDDNGTIGFEIRDGIFKSFCHNASGINAIEQGGISSFTLEQFLNYLKSIELNERTIYNYKNSINKLLGVGNPTLKIPTYENLEELCENYEAIRDFDIENNQHNIYASAVNNLIKFKNNLDTYNEAAEELKPFVFVIDEINRGEISKIFGELFFSIDPNYRGKKGAVSTQYSNLHDNEKEVFFIPENVFIIGSMNDIDRSVESFDFAMRRRFTWVEISSEQSADNMNLPQETKNRMAKLNNQIFDKEKNTGIEGLNASYHIGAAYFLDSNSNARQDYDNIWNLRIEPLLKEYLRGMPDSSDKIELLKNAFTS